MKCRKAKGLFDDYLNGVLEEPVLSELKAHRESCRDCAEELRFLEMVHQKTAGLPEEKAPADLLAKINARIDASETQNPVRKFALLTPHFAGVAVALVLVLVLFKLNSQTILKEPARNFATKSDRAGTYENAAPEDPSKPGIPAPVTGSGQKRMSARMEKPSGIATAPAAVQAPAEAKVALVEKLLVKVIRVTDNQIALADKAEENMSNLAPQSLSKGLAVKKEKTESEPLKIAASDPVKTLLEKYQGHITKAGDPSGNDEWIFEMPPGEYQNFLADLAKIGQAVESDANTDGGKKSKEIELRISEKK